jgi:hypothetical protein
LPTRILDWTFSPYVAMHFATDDIAQMNADGVIWCVNFVESTKYLPKKLLAVLELEWANSFTVEMLNTAASTLEAFDGLNREEFLVFFEPPSIDGRIVNQYALFSVMSSPTTRLDFWLSSRPKLARRIIIPASLKWEIRDKLDQANITERMLFPGLDGLSRWLKRHYSPGPKSTKTAGPRPALTPATRARAKPAPPVRSANPK